MTEIGIALSNPLHGERRAGRVGWPLPGVEVRRGGRRGPGGRTAASCGCAGPACSPATTAARPRRARPSRELRACATSAPATRWRARRTAACASWGAPASTSSRAAATSSARSRWRSCCASTPRWARWPWWASPTRCGATAWWPAWCRARARRRSAREELLRAFAKERVAAYKVPKQVVLFTELPRNAMGKVVKPELVKRVPAPSR